jgi:hypothetical protein
MAPRTRPARAAPRHVLAAAVRERRQAPLEVELQDVAVDDLHAEPAAGEHVAVGTYGLDVRGGRRHLVAVAQILEELQTPGRARLVHLPLVRRIVPRLLAEVGQSLHAAGVGAADRAAEAELGLVRLGQPLGVLQQLVHRPALVVGVNRRIG